MHNDPAECAIRLEIRKHISGSRLELKDVSRLTKLWGGEADNKKTWS
jgi:hypothetical protein